MEPATTQTILQGMGDQHIDVAMRRAETKFQVNLVAGEPRIPYQKPSPRKARPCTATRNRPAVRASSVRFTCASSR